MIYKESLLYLSEKSGVPVWILDADNNLIFSSVAESKLGLKTDICEFLSTFVCGEGLPRIDKLDGTEIYGSFGFKSAGGGEPYTLIAGPSYELHPYAGGRKGSAGILFNASSVKEILLMMPVISLTEFCRLVSVLSQIFTGRFYDVQALESELKKIFLRNLINEQLTETIFDIREEERETAYVPEAEKKVLSFVTKGDVEALQNFRMPKVKDLNARETKNQNLFESVALVTLATRAAIEGGLDYVVAFSLSDLYFKRFSKVTSDKEIDEITAQILPHFAQKVKEAANTQKKEVSSPYIVQSVQYIRAHLHSSLRLEDVARHVGLEPKYFSRLFVMLTGEKFSSFVQKERIFEAKNLLDNSNRTVIDISNSLGFSSQSYFIKVFTRYIGETPGEYLEKNKRVNKV